MTGSQAPAKDVAVIPSKDTAFKEKLTKLRERIMQSDSTENLVQVLDDASISPLTIEYSPDNEDDGITPTGRKLAVYQDAGLFAYALIALEDKVDFASYDKNGDGYITPTELAFMMVYPGFEAAVNPSFDYVNNPQPRTWAHSGTIANSFSDNKKDDTPEQYKAKALTCTVDGVQIYKYTVIAENLNSEYNYYDNSAYNRIIYSQSNLCR